MNRAAQTYVTEMMQLAGPVFVLYRSQCPFSMDALSSLKAKGITVQKLDLQKVRDEKPELYANIMEVLSLQYKAPKTVPQLYLKGKYAGDSLAIKELKL